MIRPKTSVVYILAMFIGLGFAHAEVDENELTAPKPAVGLAVDNTNNLQRLLNVRQVNAPMFLVPVESPWMQNWNNENVLENSLVSRAIVAGVSRRSAIYNLLNVTADQARAGRLLSRNADPRGLHVLSDEEFLELKNELGFGLKDIEVLRKNKDSSIALKRYIANLGMIYRHSPDELSQAQWRKLGDRMSVDLLGDWILLGDDPTHSFLSTRSQLVSSLMALPLSRGNFKALEKEWLQNLGSEFEKLILYSNISGLNEYISSTYEGFEDMNVPAEDVMDRWIQEVDALMSSGLSTARGKLLVDLFIRNMKVNKDSRIRHVARDHLMVVLADALSTEFSNFRSIWQYFEAEYSKSEKHIKHRMVQTVVIWADHSELFELEVVGKDIQSFVVNVFRDYWSDVIRLAKDQLQYRGQFVEFFEAYSKLEEPLVLASKLEGVIYKHMEYMSSNSGIMKETNNTVLKLYSMWSAIDMPPKEKLKSMRTLMEIYLIGSLDLGREFNQKFYDQYVEVLKSDPAAFESAMERFLGLSINSYPSQAQFGMLDRLSSLRPEKKRQWTSRYYRMVIDQYIQSAGIRDDKSLDPTDEKRYRRVAQMLEQLRQWEGEDYVVTLMDIRKSILGAKATLIEQINPEYPMYRNVLLQHIERNLRLFADALPTDVCNELFD